VPPSVSKESLGSFSFRSEFFLCLALVSFSPLYLSRTGQELVGQVLGDVWVMLPLRDGPAAASLSAYHLLRVPLLSFSLPPSRSFALFSQNNAGTWVENKFCVKQPVSCSVYSATDRVPPSLSVIAHFQGLSARVLEVFPPSSSLMKTPTQSSDLSLPVLPSRHSTCPLFLRRETFPSPRFQSLRTGAVPSPGPLERLFMAPKVSSGGNGTTR